MEKIICIFGDSITWGASDSKKGGWANRLIMDLGANSDYDLEGYNLGISGDTTPELLKRVESEAKTRKTDTIIFSIGINDSHKDEISLKKFEENVNDLIQKSKKITSEIIFLGINSVDESIKKIRMKNYANARIKKFENIIKVVCKENDIHYLPLFDLLSDGDLEDGLHPNDKGHEKIFQKVKDFLLENKIILN